ESEPSYKPDIIMRNSGYLFGYWQSEKYFGDIRDVILKNFDFSKGDLNEETRSLLERINGVNSLNEVSVALHVRGGDYLSKAARSFGGICTKEYYCKAIEYIAQKIKNPKFYIFTNDKEYAKAIVDAVLDSTEESLSYHFVEGNDESHAYLDLVLMSKCKHHILANSSFSWWGEYLSDQSGITIAPSKWTNDSDNKDIYRNNWVVL
ncbi:MAG: alpha-1,2-fucosyltransferase, partial [Lachnospiraceae bacterium]|nr:alpha-1,2-fucosyltransferase [Lachnospiraceae bacterium]